MTTTSGSASTAGSGTAVTIGVAVSVTCVPQPDGSSRTVPLACSPSQATVVSGSSLVILISPNSPRWRANDCATLHSAHSSGGDFTIVRLALCSSVMVEISIGGEGLLSAARAFAVHNQE